AYSCCYFLPYTGICVLFRANRQRFSCEFQLQVTQIETSISESVIFKRYSRAALTAGRQRKTSVLKFIVRYSIQYAYFNYNLNFFNVFTKCILSISKINCL
ncbi:hypothetical protein L9F63_024352, partial [Diploptera punctata]